MRNAKGQFMPGPDKDRHELTREERQKGYFTTAWEAGLHITRWRWIMHKIARFYGREHLGLHPKDKADLQSVFDKGQQTLAQKPAGPKRSKGAGKRRTKPRRRTPRGKKGAG